MRFSNSATHFSRASCAALASLALLTIGRAALDPHEEDTHDQGSRLVTLYAHDDLLSSYSFRDAAAGARVVDGEIDLTRAQVVFHVLEENTLSYGFVGMEAVNIIDLGDVLIGGFPRARDRAPKFALSLFHTLFLDGSRFSYLGAGGKVRRYGPAQKILNPLRPEGLHHIEPIVGHVYLLRSKQSGVSVPHEVVKFQVVDLQPDHSLTLRWAPIQVR